MLDLLITISYLAAIVLILCGVFFILQLSIERFLFVFVKAVALFIDQIKRPERYKDK